MPISFSVATHSANSVKLGAAAAGYVYFSRVVGQGVRESPGRGNTTVWALSRVKCGGAIRLRASFVAHEGKKKLVISNLVPSNNGFVHTVINAYNDHHALILRPDDVWLAILSQFNFFVNAPANAERLRASFVAHEGKKKLVITRVGTRHTVDFGGMSRDMAVLIEQNVVDPGLREWASPSFTTSTENDKTVAAVLLMATLRQYFSYEFHALRCGIPRVTLEGERGDWVDILGRLEKLKEYGVETIAWYHLLRPVIARFVAAFDAPASADNVDFWQRIAHFHPGMSGPDFYSGWINAFCVFSPTGEWLGHQLNLTTDFPEPSETLSAEAFWTKYSPSSVSKGSGLNIRKKPASASRPNASHADTGLVLDDTPYHRIEKGKIPVGYAELELRLVDNGKVFDGVLVAGMVGMHVSSSDATLENDVVQPASGWWFCERPASLDS
ncbi:hypothetical protein C8R43DRAFT_1152464 [Mycena crocata]|nr:hypothetical protein C8R43DRAFT_1152464 [Mycena crocata]